MKNKLAHIGLFNTVCGAKIGQGSTRTVFACNIDSSLVIKVAGENDEGRRHNFSETQLWRHIQETKWAKHFAPVRWVSPCGNVLFMDRTEVFPANDYPKKVPVFFTDLKYQNYGMLKGNFVAHDYANHLMLETGMSSTLKAAKWWDGSFPS